MVWQETVGVRSGFVLVIVVTLLVGAAVAFGLLVFSFNNLSDSVNEEANGQVDAQLLKISLPRGVSRWTCGQSQLVRRTPATTDFCEVGRS